jgi:hypothetical protein
LSDAGSSARRGPIPPSTLSTFTPVLTYILIGLAVLLVVFLVAAATRPDDLHIERSIIISAPAGAAFTQISDLSKWPVISPYAKDDPAANYTFSGPTAGVGSSLEWAGNAKVGTGRITIAESRPNELVRMKFEFFKPWYCTNTTEFIFRSTESATEATWSMSMKNNFMAKASGLVMNMDKLMGESYEAGLVNLKNLAEAAAQR